MSRSTDFDALFEQLETTLIASRAMKLKPVSDILLAAVVQATHLMSQELLRPDQRTQTK